jgi:hypothetical protein
MAKVLSSLDRSSLPPLPERLTFDDITRSSWYTPFVEFAAQKGWMLGYGNCAGTHPCSALPGATITRAEAVAMAVRYFGLKPLSLAPAFSDLPEGAWYAPLMQTAADHCLVQGTTTRKLSSPNTLLNRAQMIVLLDRARQGLIYGQDCSWDAQIRSSSSSPSSSAVHIENISSASSSEASPLPSSESSKPPALSSSVMSASPSSSSTPSSSRSTTGSQSSTFSAPQAAAGSDNTGAIAIAASLTVAMALIIVARLLL